jgi:tRNA 2-selenouridine synthase
LVEKKEQSRQILLEIPLLSRVENILNDYRPWEHHEEILQSFHRIKSRIHTPVAAEIEHSLKEGKYGQAVELLLVFYYDQRYAHTSSGYSIEQRSIIKALSIEDAVDSVEQIITKSYALNKF